MDAAIESIPLDYGSGKNNIIIGQSHFVKTVEDLGEILAAIAGAKYGLAFNEASGPCLIRTEGNDPALVDAAAVCARAVGAGHTFYIILGPGTFPIHVLDRVKTCPEVCRVFCATGNPLQVLVARTSQGAGVLGVVDGYAPKGVEGDSDKADRKALLRRFGYKFC
ncbi:MAG TPA: adenosine-specific kinase [Magnetospirillaceae bacterium]|nr:adenosine-specific kinase [Magnetospirillaceae bacterium]